MKPYIGTYRLGLCVTAEIINLCKPESDKRAKMLVENKDENKNVSWRVEDDDSNRTVGMKFLKLSIRTLFLIS